MKTLAGFISLSLSFVVAGCASAPPLTLDRVGPVPHTTLSVAAEGYLVVHPAWFPLTSLDEPDASLHSDYWILSSDGVRYRRVRVRVANTLEKPRSVALPPGLYAVEAHAAGYGKVRVPIMIAAHRTTEVYLGGDTSRRREDMACSSVVALPDGTVVGWRAK